MIDKERKTVTEEQIMQWQRICAGVMRRNSPFGSRRDYAQAKKDALSRANDMFPEIGHAIRCRKEQMALSSSVRKGLLPRDVLVLKTPEQKLGQRALGLFGHICRDGPPSPPRRRDAVCTRGADRGHNNGDDKAIGLSTYKSWADSLDVLPSDSVLQIITGGNVATFAASRSRLKTKGYNFEPVNLPVPFVGRRRHLVWLVTGRPTPPPQPAPTEEPQVPPAPPPPTQAEESRLSPELQSVLRELADLRKDAFALEQLRMDHQARVESLNQRVKQLDAGQH